MIFSSREPKGSLFQMPCCPRVMLILCVKGTHPFPLSFPRIECPNCKKTTSAMLPSEPNWTHAEVYDAFPGHENAIYQLTLGAYERWNARGRQEDTSK